MDSIVFFMFLKVIFLINNFILIEKEIEMSDKIDCRFFLILSKLNILIFENSEVLVFKDNIVYFDKVGISCLRKLLGEIIDVRSFLEGI